MTASMRAVAPSMLAATRDERIVGYAFVRVRDSAGFAESGRVSNPSQMS